MYINAVLGVWPLIKNARIKPYYEIYSKIAFTYYLFFISRAYIQLYYIISAKIIETKEIFANLATTLLCTITIMRVYIFKSKRLLNIINTIIQTENKILNSSTNKEIKMYKYFAYQSKASNNVFLVCLFIGKNLFY